MFENSGEGNSGAVSLEPFSERAARPVHHGFYSHDRDAEYHSDLLIRGIVKPKHQDRGTLRFREGRDRLFENMFELLSLDNLLRRLRCRIRDGANDIVDSGGAKLAGVLVESRGFQPGAPHYVAGFGVNITRTEFPPELLEERPVTSLALCGVEADAERSLESVLDELDAALTQLEAAPHILCSAFVERAGLYERDVEVTRADTTLRGRLLGLDLDVGLTLASEGDAQVVIPLEHVSALRHI